MTVRIEAFKGDALDQTINLNTNINNYQILAEMWDNRNNFVTKASANAGGSSSQVEITDIINGIFIVHFSTGDTSIFPIGTNVNLEIKIIDNIGKATVVYHRSIVLLDPRIVGTTLP